MSQEKYLRKERRKECSQVTAIEYLENWENAQNKAWNIESGTRNSSYSLDSILWDAFYIFLNKIYQMLRGFCPRFFFFFLPFCSSLFIFFNINYALWNRSTHYTHVSWKRGSFLVNCYHVVLRSPLSWGSGGTCGFRSRLSFPARGTRVSGGTELLLSPASLGWWPRGPLLSKMASAAPGGRRTPGQASPASACRSPPGLDLCFREPKDMLGSPGILAHQCSPSASDDVWGSFYLVETWLKLPLQLSGSPSRAARHVTPLSLPTPALAHHGQPSRSGPGGAARDPSGMRSAIGCLR